jgi:RNase P subunit RPR2
MMENKMIEQERSKDKTRRCLKCDKPLSTNTFRDESGEVIGWVVECLSCGQIFSEE